MEVVIVGKKRIYEVARDYHISSDALIAMLKGMNSTVRSHMSVVDDEMLEQIKKQFEKEKETVRQEIKKKQVIEERRKPEGGTTSPRTTSPRTTSSTVEEERKKRRRHHKKRRGGEAAPSETPQKAQGSVSAETRHVKGDKKRRRLKQKRVVDQREIEASVRRTLAQIEAGGRPRRRRVRSEPGEVVQQEERHIIKVSEFISVAELATQMNRKPAEVIAKCLEMGLMASINQRLDMETITMVADEFDYEVEQLAEYAQDLFEDKDEKYGGQPLKRPPVVTIMGHVDHGKTSLLDYIRKSNIIAGEAGGITQHIGAYEVDLDDENKITFLDTPGHEAFTAMRARGAQVTDIVVLVVAAEENVMPQTIEAIDHARAAGVPIIVAINKIDLPTANPDRIKRQLADRGLLVEEWGGKTPAVDVSAKFGRNVEKLLELIVFHAELMELTAIPDRRARGAIIDARLDPGRGCVATVLVQDGTLHVGDPCIAGLYSGRVRALLDERGRHVKGTGPSSPVQVLGLSGIPQAGDTFFVAPSERDAREIAQKRQQLKREQEYRRSRRVSLVDIHERIKEGQMKVLPLIIKGDVDGSVEALSDALVQLSNDEVRVDVIHKGVGGINESDVLLAAASNAIIIGFHVKPDVSARELSTQEQVDVRFYQIIYEAVEDVRAALSGMLTPEVSERIVGAAEVRNTFRIPKIGVIAGCYVKSGAIGRSASVRLLRDSVVIYEGSITSLRRFKDDVREVGAGFECGIGLSGFDDVQVHDLIEVFDVVETARTLA
ncbi:MAG: translation initiation factor IF-2 [Candidatus Latescibacteria bacterium]|nr:translation initiation factor IF-2 [Candidatus Latescibacterota bacterium]